MLVVGVLMISAALILFAREQNCTVPLPWTPVAADKSDETLKVDVWGREHIFAEELLPKQITTLGTDLLSAPIALIAETDGKPIEWERAYHFIASADDAQVIACGTQSSEDIIANAVYTIGYDGTIKVDMTVFPHLNSTPKLDRLWLEIPIKKSNALFYHYWPIGLSGTVQQVVSSNSGAIPEEGMQLPFKPFVWIGEDNGGLSWFAESCKNWIISNSDSAIEIVPGEETTVLRLHLLDSHPDIWGDRTDFWGTALQPLQFTFGLQATPVKDFPKDRHQLRLWAGPDNLKGYAEPQKTLDGQTGFEYITQNGIKTIHIHESWSEIQSYCCPVNAKELQQIIDGAHSRGAKVITYFGYELSTLSPDWAEYGDKCVIKGADGSYNGGYERKPAQRDYMICYNSEWQDKVLEEIKKAMEVHSTDGVYLDGTTMPWGCCNESHGCGWRDADGNLHPTYPIFAVRELMRRMYEYVTAKGGIINAHQSSCCTTPSLGFVHSYWDGENLQSSIVDDPLAVLPLDAFRAEFIGRNFGVPGDFLIYQKPPKWNYSEALAINLLHDVLPRPSGFSEGNKLVFKLWKIYDNFELANSEWFPYWGEVKAAICDADGIKCSGYINRSSGKMLLIVSNLSDTSQKAHLTINSDLFGEGRKIASAKEKLYRLPVSFDENIFTLNLDTLEAAVVLVK